MLVKVWFLRHTGLRAALERLLLTSPWNSVAIECKNVFYTCTRDTGVTTLTPAEFEWMFSKRTYSSLRVNDPQKMTNFLARQIKRPLSWRCYVPFLRGESWVQSESWFSSELVVCALKEAGCSVSTSHRRCTPSQLWRQLPKVVVNHQI